MNYVQKHVLILVSQVSPSSIRLNISVIIEKDQSSRPLIVSVQQRFNLWLQRDLSITRRSLSALIEGLSRHIYAAMALGVSKDTCTKIDKILSDFIWKKKIHYIKKNVMISKLCSGGLNALDFTSLNASFKVKWITLFFFVIQIFFQLNIHNI